MATGLDPGSLLDMRSPPGTAQGSQHHGVSSTGVTALQTFTELTLCPWVMH